MGVRKRIVIDPKAYSQGEQLMNINDFDQTLLTIKHKKNSDVRTTPEF